MDQTDTIVTGLQYEKMVDIMETVPAIARASFKGDPSAFWAELAESLNCLGAPIKAETSWKRVWFDYVRAVKKKLRDNMASSNATGEEPCPTKTLNDLEERVARLVNLRATVVRNNRNDKPTDNQSESNSNNQQQPDHQEQQVQQERQNSQISGPSKRVKKMNRKRKALEMMRQLEQQNKEMQIEWKKCVEYIQTIKENQEKIQNLLAKFGEKQKISNQHH